MSSSSPAIPGRRFLAATVIAAPVLLLLSDVAYISAGAGINNGVLGGTIGVWSTFVLGWALVGISRALEPLAPRGAFALLLLALPAISGGVAFNVNAIHREHFGNDFMSESSVGVLAFLPWGLFAPASLVLLGVVLWRTRYVARWAAAMVAVGGLLFVSARPNQIDALAIVTDVTLVAGLGAVGMAMLAERAGSTERAPGRAEQTVGH